MKKRRVDRNMPIGDLERIDDFLPPPEGLFNKEKNMTYLSMKEAQRHLSEIIKKIEKHKQYFIIYKNSESKAVIMSIDEYEGWMETLEVLSDKRAMKSIEKAEKELAKGKYCTLEELDKKIMKKRQR